MRRCSWVNDDPIYQRYHDDEWGVVQKDSLKIFEQLCLEGMQSGLSWYIILKKRPGYRRAFLDFDPYQISKFTDEDVDKLMLNDDIIRHRAKIQAIITNAKAYLQYEAQHGKGSFSQLIWQFTDYHIIRQTEKISQNEVSKTLSKTLKKLGFKFVGPTTAYALMQAIGMYDSHEIQCDRRLN